VVFDRAQPLLAFVIPLVLAGLALAVQLVAIPLERDDAAAFGDNIGGLVMLAPFSSFR
jgi:hypothetical protein